MDYSLSNLSITVVINYVQSFGIMAPLAAFLLFALQAALPVLPYVVLASACGMLFGFKLGFLLSWSGALLGACVAYMLSRWAGGNWARQMIQSRWGYDMRHFDQEAAFWGILLARIIPVVPTPIINIAAGISKVPFWHFFFSSALGKLPTALLYTGLGISLLRNRDVKSTAIILGLILILAWAGRCYAKSRTSSRTPLSQKSQH
jgi:uncharacterized membrane protein YdjX (TVP38/TMEM64 family)